MSENLNGQFPPISKNGKATGTESPDRAGQADHPKRTDSHKTQPDNKTNNESAKTTATSPNDEPKRRTTGERIRPTQKETTADHLNPTQVVSSKVSAYIAKYPWQTIGGLLGLLLVIFLFKTFYQSKNWKAKRMAEEAYYMANQYARNNNANLQPYLSQAFRREVRQTPGLLPLSMQSATRGGSIAGAEAVNLREITSDSVLVEVAVRFENGREEKRYQPLVYEKDQWRLGLTYSK